MPSRLYLAAARPTRRINYPGALVAGRPPPRARASTAAASDLWISGGAAFQMIGDAQGGSSAASDAPAAADRRQAGAEPPTGSALRAQGGLSAPRAQEELSAPCAQGGLSAP